LTSIFANPATFYFEVVAQDDTSGARLGRMITPHGTVETPAFMPVGTLAAVKAIDPDELRASGAQIILANTYHLALRPGSQRIASAGGLHRFMAWERPILTDSGGFQIWSLADRACGRSLVRTDDDGATFTSHVDGRKVRFTPESAVDVQVELGADVIMALDECTAKDADERTARTAAERTHRWARRCRERWLRQRQEGAAQSALFGIVQGGHFREARRISAQEVAALDLPGIAVGGESIGFSKAQTGEILFWIEDLLPDDRPRYAMGVGDPVDFPMIVDRGIDLFDSVLPTRLARNGALLTRSERLRIGAPAFRADEGPVDPACGCYTCRRYSRAYLHHLYRTGELLAHRLGTIHNVTYCLSIAAEMRDALRAGQYGAWKRRQRSTRSVCVSA
jgi:queuine tRNA-ribosyltransferase